MSKDIVVKKGLDLRLIGAPSLEIEEAKFSKDYSVYPADFHGVYPKLIVKENDSVKAGEALFFDKNSKHVNTNIKKMGLTQSFTRIRYNLIFSLSY